MMISMAANKTQKSNENIDLIEVTPNALDNKIVKESNHIIMSQPDMTWEGRKMTDLAISVIDRKELETRQANGESVFPEGQLLKEDLYAYFGLDHKKSNSKYNDLRKKLNSATKNSGFIIGNGIGRVNVFQWITWGKRGDPYVYFAMTQPMTDYVLNLESNYTQYLAIDTKRLLGDSVFLYPWINRHYKEYEAYVGTGKRTAAQLEALRTPYVSRENLILMFNRQGQYKQFNDFEKRVLKPAIAQINEETYFKIDYTKQKSGRTIVGVRFTIDKREPVVLPADDLQGDYGRPMDVTSTSISEDFTTAIASPYTKLLVTFNLLLSEDLIDQDLMARMNRTVYEMYRKIEAIGGLAEVQTHIKYVADRQNADSNAKRNIQRYLQTAVESYWQRGVVQEKYHAAAPKDTPVEEIIKNEKTDVSDEQALTPYQKDWLFNALTATGQFSLIEIQQATDDAENFIIQEVFKGTASGDGLKEDDVVKLADKYVEQVRQGDDLFSDLPFD